MSKFFYILLILLSPFFFSAEVSAQMQAAHWVFGSKGHISFPFGYDSVNTNYRGSLINTSNIPSSNFEGSASISDVNGNLKLYTNGVDVYNGDHIKLNEERLKGNFTVSQSSIFVPVPGKYNQYILFTINAHNLIAPRNDVSVGFDFGLYYYTIDLNKNNGRGKLNIPQNNRLLKRTAEKIAAVYHQNGKDIWVITYFENQFYAYLVTENGIEAPVISQVPYFSSVLGYAANSKGQL
ncbi:MAG TPA: hypothetical protein VIG94_01355 [Faecalibacter sp.]